MHKKFIKIVSCFLSFLLIFSLCCGASYIDTSQSRSTSSLGVYGGIVIFENQSNSLYISDYDYYSVVLEEEEYVSSHEEKWELIYESSGYYRIKNLKSGNVLTAPATDDGVVSLEASSSSNTLQLWSFSSTPNGYFTISPAYDYGTGEYVLSCSDTVGFYGYNVVLSEYVYDNDFSDEWQFIYMDAFLLGIPDYSPGSTHDHSSALQSASNLLSNRSYNSLVWLTSAYTETQRARLNNYMKYCDYFAFRGHGYCNPTVNSTSILVLNGDTDGTLPREISSNNIFNYSSNTVVTDMSGCHFALFTACNTAGYTVRDENTGEIIERVTLTQSLPFAATRAGANYAIGFRDTLDCSAANFWTEQFFEYYFNGGYTVELGISVFDAANTAVRDYYEEYPNDTGAHLDSILITS